VKSKLVQLSQSFDGLSSQSPMVSEMTVTATRCLSQLDERSRLVIALNVIAGFTIDETAVTLGLTTSAVASIKRRALLKLRECCRGIEDEK
jgi:DNA-directed RNA polymerase specialized sigma24 family protein